MPTYRPATPADIPAIKRAISLAFGGTEDDAGTWIERIGLDIVRTLHADDQLAATSILAPMGQFFGSKRVPMTGIAGVTVTPEMRGRSLAQEIMRRSLEELRATTPISVLYASTQGLYRRVGYEQAGHLCRVTLPLKSITGFGRTAALRPARDEDHPAIEDCYRRCVQHLNGYIDRGHYVWDRVRAPKGRTARAFVFDGPSSIDAYAYVLQDDAGLRDGRHDLSVNMHAATPEGARALLGFLAGFSSMAHNAIFYSGPTDPLLMLLPEQHFTLTRREYWMLRIADVPAALRARGYSRALKANVTLHITNDTFPDNTGAYRLAIDDGTADVERTRTATIHLDVRALAAIYTGFMDPRALARIGLIQGPDEALATLAAIFAGPPPAMSDMF